MFALGDPGCTLKLALNLMTPPWDSSDIFTRHPSYILRLCHSIMQALPPTHPIVAAVAADRMARKALSSINPHDIKAAGVRDLHDSQAHVDHVAIDSSDAADRASGSAVTAPGGNAARCAALLAAVDESGARKDDLLFCSKHWLIQVDRHTGGRTLLHKRSFQQQQQQQQGVNVVVFPARHI